MAKYDYYPALGPLVGVLRLVLTDPEGYLGDENCPYTDDEKVMLRGPSVVAADPMEEIDLTELDVAEEATKLYRAIQKWGKGLDQSDTAEMATVFRNSTTLLDRLLTIASKANDIKELMMWKAKLLQFMEDVLDEDQRIAFEQRLVMELEKSK